MHKSCYKPISGIAYAMLADASASSTSTSTSTATSSSDCFCFCFFVSDFGMDVYLTRSSASQSVSQLTPCGTQDQPRGALAC
jgi:hypothetical protein